MATMERAIRRNSVLSVVRSTVVRYMVIYGVCAMASPRGPVLCQHEEVSP